MSSSPRAPASRALPGAHTLRDYVALTKPRITLMVVITAAGGMWLAPSVPDAAAALAAFVALALVVGSANALNCWLERDVDRLMKRTMHRPLPDDRLSPRPALVFGIVMGLVAVPALWIAVNPVTGLLGAASLVIYVGLYTPLKQITPTALLVGAVPGAIPPLMGWTAATGRIDLPGVVLFGILFAWQIPHFLAISVFREQEYTRAGLKTLPAVRGARVTHVHAVVWAAVLLAVSLALVPLGVAGWAYGAVALTMGLLFLVATIRGLSPSRGAQGARRAFVASLVYLPVVFAAAMADAL